MNASSLGRFTYNIYALGVLLKGKEQMNFILFLVFSRLELPVNTQRVALGNVKPFSKIHILKLSNCYVLQNISQ